jgi:hypothetical protein
VNRTRLETKIRRIEGDEPLARIRSADLDRLPLTVGLVVAAWERGLGRWDPASRRRS